MSQAATVWCINRQIKEYREEMGCSMQEAKSVIRAQIRAAKIELLINQTLSATTLTEMKAVVLSILEEL
jgi:hypothetical protein